MSERDTECPECQYNAHAGDCVCPGGDQMDAGRERFIEFREAGREQTKRSKKR